MTLYLVLKGEWFDKIERGEKTHEYREVKPYWEKRLMNYLSRSDDWRVVFVRGYQKNAPKLEAEVVNFTIKDGRGTDLEFPGFVYDIHFRNVRRIV